VIFVLFSIDTFCINIVWLAFPNLKLLMKARMLCPQIINVNWYCLKLLAYPQRMYQEHWPLALERFLIIVGLSVQNLLANVTSFSPWPEQHEVGSGAILLCNYIIRPLPSTYEGCSINSWNCAINQSIFNISFWNLAMLFIYPMSTHYLNFNHHTLSVL